MPEATEETTSTDESPDLGEAGKRALDSEREARRTAERDARQTRAELDQLRKTTMTETEKAIALAKDEARREVLSTVTDRLVRAEIRSAAGQKLADPGDAAALLGDLSRFVDDKGDVDERAVTKAIDDLVKAKPYLSSAATNVGSADGGSRESAPAGSTMTDLIRLKAGRGR